MNNPSDHHATIFVDPEAAAEIEAVRRKWDPEMAGQIAAHVTLVYPHEAPSDLLVQRIQEAATEVSPFRLRLGRVACFGRPEDGVYVEVEDVDGGYARLREQALNSPSAWFAIPPHVTLLHPRTSSRGKYLWGVVHDRAFDLEFTVEEVSITASDGASWIVVQNFSLR